MTDKLAVRQMFAYLGIDANGDEGLIAAPAFVFGFAGDGPVPLVGADIERMESLRPIAQEIANVRGTAITLAVFSAREDKDMLMPAVARPVTTIVADMHNAKAVRCPHCHRYREAVPPEQSTDGAFHFVCKCGHRWAGFEDGAPIGYGGVNPAARKGES